MSTIVCVEIHLLDFLEERESRVSTGTLVIECLLNHCVKSVEEVLLVNAVVLDGLLNADSILELVDLLDKTFNLSLVVLAGYTEELSNLSITTHGVRVSILRECTHLSRSLSAVEADNFVDQQSVCDTVGQVVERTELVSHRVANTQECVSKCHTSHCSSVSHVFTSNRIIYAGDSGIISSRQVLEDELEGLECENRL